RSAATRPAVEVLKLVDAAIFNLLIANADAHGKNFGLLHDPDETILAPLYDLMCTAAYPELSAKPAMRIADASSSDDFTPRTWQTFAEKTKTGLPLLRRRVKELSRMTASLVEGVADAVAAAGFDADFLSRTAKTICERADRIGGTVS
ncbi:MAG TPA: HipA domain-containing protein, partial [Rhizomicrobium sp.]